MLTCALRLRTRLATMHGRTVVHSHHCTTHHCTPLYTTAHHCATAHSHGGTPSVMIRLVKFDYNWNKQANMLYLEAPVGVGFSYSTEQADYKCTDDTTAIDNLHSVEAFYEKFPELKPNGLFITGESYGHPFQPPPTLSYHHPSTPHPLCLSRFCSLALCPPSLYIITPAAHCAGTRPLRHTLTAAAAVQHLSAC